MENEKLAYSNHKLKKKEEKVKRKGKNINHLMRLLLLLHFLERKEVFLLSVMGEEEVSLSCLRGTMVKKGEGSASAIL